MEFFGRIKTKLKIKNLMWAAAFAILCISAIALAVSTGFSSDTDMQIGLRGFAGGLPIPNWLFSLFLIALSLLFMLGAFSSIKSFFRNKEYTALINSAADIGELDVVGKLLDSMGKSPYAKGDLRCNQRILFYMFGTEITILKTGTINKLQKRVKQTRSGKEYTVSLYYEDAKTLDIRTTKKHIDELAHSLISII